MTTTTRRSFLGGLAVASALARSVPATANNSPSEDADLLALAPALQDAEDRMNAAAHTLATCQAAFYATAPEGLGIVFEQGSPEWRLLRHVAEPYSDPARPNGSYFRNDGGGMRFYVPACRVADLAAGADKRNAAYWKGLLKRAEAFERETEEALQATGLAAAIEEYNSATNELKNRTVKAIMDIRARTMEGIALKIRATAAYASLGETERQSARIWLAEAVWNDLG